MKKLFFLLAVCVILPVSAQQHARNSVRYYEETVGNLGNQVRNLQDENARLAGEIMKLREKIRIMEQNNMQISRDMAEIKRAFTDLREKNDKQLGMIADRISKTGAEMRKQEVRQAARTEEVYDEYVVQPGATLSAIARAAGVSVAEIKQANNLKNNNLRVGMKLRIPRKNKH